jgi:hypothetical protein
MISVTVQNGPTSDVGATTVDLGSPAAEAIWVIN